MRPHLILLACSMVPSGLTACETGEEDTTPEADTDADSDVDSDSDVDPCAEIPTWCCTPQCPCGGGRTRCVTTYDTTWDGAPPHRWGVCKPQFDGSECWDWKDCAKTEFCAGLDVCPCEQDCDWESSGTCAPASGPCCDDDPDACPEHYFCMAFEGKDTCHGALSYPLCWNDGSCYGGTCEGALLCSCEMNCVSRPGTCTYP